MNLAVVVQQPERGQLTPQQRTALTRRYGHEVAEVVDNLLLEGITTFGSKVAELRGVFGLTAEEITKIYLVREAYAEQNKGRVFFHGVNLVDLARLMVEIPEFRGMDATEQGDVVEKIFEATPFIKGRKNFGGTVRKIISKYHQSQPLYLDAILNPDDWDQ